MLRRTAGSRHLWKRWKILCWIFSIARLPCQARRFLANFASSAAPKHSTPRVFSTPNRPGFKTATASVPVGIELYSVREELKKDPEGTQRAVTQMGTDGVEFYATYFDCTVSETKQY